MAVVWLDQRLWFPDVEHYDSSGIVAVGGDLSPARLLLAYRKGIFPWFNADEPILWWSPDPRFVLFPQELKVARSMRPYFNQRRFTISLDTCFEAVMRACAQQYRSGQRGTWITGDMIAAYHGLHQLGYAHSVEVWNEAGQLVGGLYGVAMGAVFFGESMFTYASNASKFGFIALVKRLQKLGFRLIDCQQETRHLASLGARAIPRREFIKHLQEYVALPDWTGNWGQMPVFQQLERLE